MTSSISMEDLKKEVTDVRLPEDMNIYQKMSAITSDLKRVAKNLNVGLGKASYKAVGEADILDAVKPLEEKYHIYSYPLERIIEDSGIMENERIDYNTKQPIKSNQLYMRIRTIYRFVNIDNPDERIDIHTYGDGVDTQDKAPGKAMTYADKYALMKAYKITTGDDPDQNASDELKNINKTANTHPANIGKLSVEWQSLRTKMTALGIDFRSEEVKQWICNHTGYASQEADDDVVHMEKTIQAYKTLIAGKEAKQNAK